jgi:hypothetical protein
VKGGTWYLQVKDMERSAMQHALNLNLKKDDKQQPAPSSRVVSASFLLRQQQRLPGHLSQLGHTMMHNTLLELHSKYCRPVDLCRDLP